MKKVKQPQRCRRFRSLALDEVSCHAAGRVCGAAVPSILPLVRPFVENSKSRLGQERMTRREWLSQSGTASSSECISFSRLVSVLTFLFLFTSLRYRFFSCSYTGSFISSLFLGIRPKGFCHFLHVCTWEDLTPRGVWRFPISSRTT